MITLSPFHLAIPVRDVNRARNFYVDVLGCSVGRSASDWVDLNLFGHQLVCHQVSGAEANTPAPSNPVDGHDVPIPHFGVVMGMADWRELAQRLEQMDTSFVIPPYIRFEGLAGEQGTLFFEDPDGNAIEFKGFRDVAKQLFETES